MSPSDISEPERVHLESLVEHYRDRRYRVLRTHGDNLRNALETHSTLAPLIHSLRLRMKSAASLRDKLTRKLRKAKAAGDVFSVTQDSLPRDINDLIGIRILHLYQQEMTGIDPALRACLLDNLYELAEGPIARVWDSETRAFFTSLGIQCEENDRMYTSVHYVVASKHSGGISAEIQVRTLAEELCWEVDHRINYPNRSDSLACREQILVLARLTSGCTRLADSIFRSQEDHKARG